MTDAPATTPLLEARGLTKHYGHVEALRDADFSVNAGEVVAMIGDNGAGKSTLVKILAGVTQPDHGEILFEGQSVTMPTPTAARRLGIETVYQDLALAPDLDPAANLFLGRERLRGGVLGRLGVLDKKAMAASTRETFNDLRADLQSYTMPVGFLSGGQRQSIAVGRAAAWASKLVFMDEPTAALGVVQSARVLELVRRVRDTGMGVVFISHNMPNVLEVADRIEVLRLGRRVARFRTDEVSMEDLVGAMTGAVVQEDAS
jgi:simple sugar transport system ATP-binding protein